MFAKHKKWKSEVKVFILAFWNITKGDFSPWHNDGKKEKTAFVNLAADALILESLKS